MEQQTRIAIVGAGNVGGNLGVRLTQSGYEIKFGTRQGSDISAVIERCNGRAQAGLVADVAQWAEVIFLAVPASAVVNAAQSLGNVSGKIVVDCNNPLRWDNGPVWNPPAEGSLTAAIAKAIPDAKVVKAFNTFGAEFHENPKIQDTSADVFLAGDDKDAKQVVASIAETAGFSAIDAGPLRNAAVLENVAMLWIHLALVGGQGRNMAFKLLKR